MGKPWNVTGRQFSAADKALFHAELDAIRRAHNGQTEVNYGMVPVLFFPSIYRRCSLDLEELAPPPPRSRPTQNSRSTHRAEELAV